MNGDEKSHNATMNDLIRGVRSANAAQAAAVLGFAPPPPPPGADPTQALEAERTALVKHGAESAEHRAAQYLTDQALEQAGSTREQLEAEHPPPSFDGGTRPLPPDPPPSMGSILRSAIAHRNESILNYAEDLDRWND